MNDLFDAMNYAYEKFCRTAQRFLDAAKEQNTPKAETPDYNSWIGKVVYVWDDGFPKKQKALLLEYNANCSHPFRTAGTRFKHAELCEDQ